MATYPNFDSDVLAEIAGIHAGDGYLRNKNHKWEWDVSGSYDEKEYYDNHVIPLFNKLFSLGIKGRFFPCRHTYGFVIRDREIIKYAHNVLGFPYGSKSSKVRISDMIMQNRNLWAPFLRGYFDTDGHYSCAKKYGKYGNFKKCFHAYPRVAFSTISRPLSNDLFEIFNSLGWKCCSLIHKPLKKTESLKYRYEFNGINRVHRVMKFIKPKNSTKNSRYLIWKKFGFCPTNISYSQRILILKNKLNPYIFYKGL